MAQRWRRFEKYSSWRKISVGMWDTPRDPTVYGFETLDVTDTLEYLEAVSEASGVRVTMTALWVYVVAQAFARHPELNVIIVGDRVLQREHVNIFCQVAVPGSTPDQTDLSGVRLEDVDRMSIVEIAERMRGKARRVRKGEDEEIERQKSLIDRIPARLMRRALRLLDFLTFEVPVDLDDLGLHSDPFGSCMISSIAQFDLRLGLAPLVPAARVPLVILPGATFQAPMVVDGEVRARTVMQGGLTCDHRAYDGYQIGYIARAIRHGIEGAAKLMPAPETFRREPVAEAEDELGAAAGE